MELPFPIPNKVVKHSSGDDTRFAGKVASRQFIVSDYLQQCLGGFLFFKKIFNTQICLICEIGEHLTPRVFVCDFWLINIAVFHKNRSAVS